MATELEESKWKLHCKKYDALLLEGAEKGLVKLYDQELLEKLRHVYVGGLPVSFIILHDCFSNGHCYDVAPLITYAFGDDNYTVVKGDVDTIKLNPKYIDKKNAGMLGDSYADHCFVEREEKDGKTWVYDTSNGMIFEKELYYALERPNIRKRHSKQATIDYLRTMEGESPGIDEDKYALPLIIPCIELGLMFGYGPIQKIYKDYLDNELKLLKEELNYDEIVEEIHADMREKMPNFFKK